MKYALREDVQVDFFSDGEAVVYDGGSEIMHVLNVTAAMVLNIIMKNEDNPEKAFMTEVWNYDPEVSASILKNDFQNILSNFIEVKLVIVKESNVKRCVMPLTKGVESMKYVTPVIRSFTKGDIRKNIISSATCIHTVCSEGQSFTCSEEVNYISRRRNGLI